jgi:hypothetical protein
MFFAPTAFNAGVRIRGVIMSFTNEDTIALKAAPIITATAKSITFPFKANALKSLIKLI